MNATINTITATMFAKDLDATKLSAACVIFTDADNSSASFAEKLGKLGIGDRATARPFALVWAAKKYNAKLEEGQRGHKLPRDSAAEKAMQRVMNVCFPETANPFEKAAGAATSNPVEKLLKAYAKLDAGQKRSFKAQLAKM